MMTSKPESHFGTNHQNHSGRFKILLLLVAFSVGINAVFDLLLPSQHAFAQSKDRQQGEIRASRIVLEDNEGRSRCIIEVSDGNPRIQLRDKSGIVRAGVAIGDDGPLLWLADENGKAQLGLSNLSQGPMLSLMDGSRHPRALFGLTGEMLTMSLHDKNGAPLALLTAKDRGAALSLECPSKNSTVKLGAMEGLMGLDLSNDDVGISLCSTLSGGGLAIKDSKKRLRASFALESNSSPSLRLTHTNGKSLALFKVESNGSLTKIDGQ